MSDLIKREDAIKALRKLGHEVVVIDKVCSLGVAAEFIDAIRTIPSADRPQGEWIHDYHFGLALPEHKCSVCGEWEYSDTESNYCPNCGAMMKGADDE